MPLALVESVLPFTALLPLFLSSSLSEWTYLTRPDSADEDSQTKPWATSIKGCPCLTHMSCTFLLHWLTHCPSDRWCSAPRKEGHLGGAGDINVSPAPSSKSSGFASDVPLDLFQRLASMLFWSYSSPCSPPLRSSSCVYTEPFRAGRSRSRIW